MIAIDWQDFGERVLLARRRLKISQTTAAKQIGISRNYLSQIELGIADPSYTIAATICQFFGIGFPLART